MTKILIIAERFHPEDFIINDLATEWQKMGVEVTVLTQQPSYPFGKVYANYNNKVYTKEMWSNFTIHRFFTITGYHKSLIFKIFNYFNFMILATLFSIVLGRKFDNIFVFQTGSLTQAIPAVITKKIWRKQKISIWTLDVWPDTVYAYGFKKSKMMVWFLNNLVKFIYCNCTNIFISCKGFKNIITKYCNGTQKIIYAPNWPLTSTTTSNIGNIEISGDINYIFTGNIGKVQNLENVVLGFKIFSDKHQNSQLHLVGDGSNLENIKQLVSNEKINNVVFWGRRQSDEMSNFYQKCDVLIISLTNKPIFNLTVPLKFQAYLKAQKPIFCVVEGEVKKLTIENNLGLCAHPDDIQEIALKFEEFYNLKQQNKLGDFSQNSLKLLENEFNRDKIIKNMLNTILTK